MAVSVRAPATTSILGGTIEIGEIEELADGTIIIGDGADAPTTLAAFVSSTGALKHESGGLELDISGIVAGDFIVGTGAGTLALESGATVRTSLGLGTGDSPTFTSLNLSANVLFSGATPSIETDTAGDTITLKADATVTNLTLSGAAGSELATFVKDVAIGTGAISVGGLHVSTNYSAPADGLHSNTNAVFSEMNSAMYIHLLAATTSATGFRFGDADNGDEGIFVYDNNADNFIMVVSGTTVFSASASATAITGTFSVSSTSTLTGDATLEGQVNIGAAGSADDVSLRKSATRTLTIDSGPTLGTGMTVNIAGTSGTSGTLNVHGIFKVTSTSSFEGDVAFKPSSGATANFKVATTTLTGMSGATVTATNLIPAGSFIFGVSVRVTTEITGATTFTIGDGIDVDRWGTGIALTAGTTTTITDFTASGFGEFSSANNVVLTATGSNFTAGAVRLVVHYIDLTAPTS